MSDRLISADRTKFIMRKQNCTYCEYRLCDGCWVNKVLGIIDEQTTAYDVDEKMSQIAEERDNALDASEIDDYFLGVADGLKIALNTVKDGGCDDEHTQEEFEHGTEPYCDDDGNNL